MTHRRSLRNETNEEFIVPVEVWKETAAWLMNEINIRHKGNTYEAS